MLKEYVIRLVGRCNERCLFCFVMDEIEAGAPITLEEVLREIGRARDQGFERVDFFGGEPTTYPSLVEAMRHCASLGLPSSLGTNALRFSDEAYARDFFKQVSPCSIRVSLYSHDAAVHDRITKVPGSFVKTLGGLKNIFRLADPATRVSVTTVVTAWNYENLAPIVEIAHGLGGKIIKLSCLVPTDRVFADHPELMVDLQRVQAPLERAIAAARERGMFFCLERFPLCIAPEWTEHNVDRMSDARNGMEVGKVLECAPCRYRYECPGLIHAPPSCGTPAFIKAIRA